MENKISLKGGVLIIGSLLWDDQKHRVLWRADNLDKSGRLSIKAPIRYGRVSSSRNCTYTMVFSKDCDNAEMIGQGVFLPFKKQVDLAGLLDQAKKLKVAEHPATSKVDDWLNWNWGCVGICFNPMILSAVEKKNEIEVLLSKWKTKYNKLDSDEYKVGGELPVINGDGVFQINWPEGLEEFDFFIGTATKPDLKEYPNSKKIAVKMIVNEYDEYFKTNSSLNIATFQDADIKAELEKG